MVRMRRDVSILHNADLCENDAALAESVADFMANGHFLAEPMVLITTPERRESISASLARMGVSWPELEEKGHATFRNGLDLLDRFMVDGMPDEAAFADTLEEVLQHPRRGPTRRIRCFGDMVDVLCAREQPAAALRLEQLWNSLARFHRFSLLCGYIKNNLYRELNGGHAAHICEQHASVRNVDARHHPGPHGHA